VKRARNDLGQYDDLAAEWWNPQGEFAALHWLAEARASLVPSGTGDLLDIGCGGGLLAPHIHGYRHVGVDLTASALQIAAQHGIEPVQADAANLPFDDASFDVVVAGEVLEHVSDLEGTVAEATRVLKPGGTFVCDTINRTWFSRLTLVTIGERLRGGPPMGCHDHRLFVAPTHLQELCARGGVDLHVHGLAPHPLQYLQFLARRRDAVGMVRTRSLAAVYQGVGHRRRARSSAA
jgi:2-polyprenyl-6-hydroxyphenyl methylase/3-demethylubiquinone-9 3-methyltransferase